jgi:30S ribosomal protein S31
MGKGDRRSKKGKIHIGTYGNTRPQKAKKKVGAAPKGAKKR